jgi:hypothetical protein
METISKIIEGSILNKIVELPKSLQDGLVKITITPVDKDVKPVISRSKLHAQLKDSHTNHLSGILQEQENISLEELQAERRSKL